MRNKTSAGESVLFQRHPALRDVRDEFILEFDSDLYEALSRQVQERGLDEEREALAMQFMIAFYGRDIERAIEGAENENAHEWLEHLHPEPRTQGPWSL